MAHRGIIILSEGISNGINPQLDIIAVHGLNGDSEKTWTHRNGSMWLKDFLPSDIPNARIMTFGYDSKLRGTTINGVRESAHLLLKHLQNKRCNQPAAHDRPIVFICHSLGGIIVKEALVKAASNREFANIRLSTIATLFMGTPHRGSQAATLGNVIGNIARIFFLDISTSHLQELLPGSRELESLSNSFCQIIADPEIEVVNFYEDSRVRIGLSSILVVPQASAVMDPSGSIREGISLHGNHRQICQFSDRDNSEYVLFRGTLQQILENRILKPSQTSLYSLYLWSTADQSLLSWLRYIVPVEDVAFEGSCTWFHQKPEVQDWQAGPNPALLWIHGPQGVGKTVLSSYITNFMRSNSKYCVAHTFCNSRSRHPNALSVVHGMVSQVARENIASQDVKDYIIQLRNDHANINDVPFQQLVGVFAKLLELRPRNALIVDAIDEWDYSQPEFSDLLNFLINISKKPVGQVKVLFLSRDVPSIRNFLAFEPSFGITEEDNMPGILRFTRERIRSFAYLEPCATRIEDVVVERSRGLFLWVEYFMDGFEGLRNMNDIRDYIDGVKGGLSSMYEDIFERIEASKPELLKLRKKILMFTSASFRPLWLSELEEAIAVRHDLSEIDLGNKMLGGWQTVQDACDSLLQLIDGKVELPHISAREFMLSSTSRLSFPSLPRDAEEAHREIANVCLTYLRFKELRMSLTGDSAKDRDRRNKYPLLEYAALYWPDHFIQSGTRSASLLEPLEQFITSLSGITWAVSYFPQFKLEAGESLFSTSGLLQIKIAQIKSIVRRILRDETSKIRMVKLIKHLDTFLVHSFEAAVFFENRDSGATARNTIERRLDLSKVYQSTQDFILAQTAAAEAQNIAYSNFGDQDSLTLRCEHQVIQVAMELELGKEAQSFAQITSSFQALLDPLERVLGNLHKDTLRCRHDVGLSLTYEKRFGEGLAILEEVLYQMYEQLGETSTLTQRTANNVANTLYNLDRYEEVEAVLIRIPEVQFASLPNPAIKLEACHPYTFDSLSILGLNSYMVENYERSLLLHIRAMEGREGLFGKNDALLLNFARNLGLVFEALRQYDTAAEHYKEWLGVANRYGMRVKAKQLQIALTDCQNRWVKALARGSLVPELPKQTFRASLDLWVKRFQFRDIILVFVLMILVLLIYVS